MQVEVKDPNLPSGPCRPWLLPKERWRSLHWVTSSDQAPVYAAPHRQSFVGDVSFTWGPTTVACEQWGSHWAVQGQPSSSPAR